jgi:hypothetical protein
VIRQQETQEFRRNSSIALSAAACLLNRRKEIFLFFGRMLSPELLALL